MRTAEYKVIFTELVEQEITIPAEYDEEGNLLAEEHTEVVTVERPVMGVVYRDMTPEEEAEMAQAEGIPVEQSRETALEARVAELEEALKALIEGAVE